MMRSGEIQIEELDGNADNHDDSGTGPSDDDTTLPSSEAEVVAQSYLRLP